MMLDQWLRMLAILAQDVWSRYVPVQIVNCWSRVSDALVYGCQLTLFASIHCLLRLKWTQQVDVVD